MQSDRSLFDEAGYLRLYRDLAAAVAAGRLVSGWVHYNEHGRSEGRRSNDVDDEFYLGAYPLAATEIAQGRANCAAHHYISLGRARGWLPNSRAPRPANGSAISSPFGGLWTDRPDAGDLIDGKVECGLITQTQADRLRFWVDNGYVVLSQAVPEPLVDRAAQDLDRAYSGQIPNLKFECHAITPDSMSWQPAINVHPSKALDIHHFSSAIRDLIFSDAISEFLALIFETKAFASQTLGFLRGSAQEGHQDSAYVAYTVGRQFAATWIALEDVTVGAGELFYYPGSHRLPDFLYKSVQESKRLEGDTDLNEQIRTHVAAIEHGVRETGLSRVPFAAKKGDVLFWHADLVHGGHPVSADVTRKSIVTHYCPKYRAPLFSEWLPTKIWTHGGHLYTSSHYLDLDPIGD
jgi:hypothetical protein